MDGRETWQTVRGLTTHTITTYDSNGDATAVATMPDGTVQTQVTQSGRIASSEVNHPSLGQLSLTTYDYDPHGRLWHQTTAAGTTSYTYFADDQVETITTPDPDTTRAGPGYDPQVTAYRYDAAGRVDRVTQPDATETFTTYTPAGQVLRTWGSRTYPQSYTYDVQQRVKTLTTWQGFANEAGGAVTTWNYDPRTGRLLGKRDAGNQGASYTYWPSGRLKTRTWARGLVTTYAYTPAGDLATVDYSDGTPDITHAYDRLGRVKATADAAGLLTRSYDNGRLDDEAYTGTGLLAGQSLARSFDSLHRLGSLSASSVESIGYQYDAASRLSSITQGSRVATQTYHATRGYPEAVEIALAGTSRLTATRTLDNLGRTASVSAPAVSAIAYDYNAANQRIKAVNTLDGAYWSYGYDALGQVTSAEKREADTTPRPGHLFGYQFDDIGNRRQTTLNNLTSIYGADLNNQYYSRTTPAAVPVLGVAAPSTTVKINDQTAATRSGDWFYHELALDGSGAPQYLQFPVSATTLQGEPPTSELVRSETRRAYVPASPETYTYDADGNLTQDGRWNYTWDAENRLVGMETRADMAAVAPGLPRQRLAFAYDGNGRRIQKKVEGHDAGSSTWSTTADLRFLYDGWNLVGEYNALSGNALVRSYTWGLDISGGSQGAGGVGGLLWASAGTTACSPAYDGNGNIAAWVDLATGSKVAENDYDAFGGVIQVAGTNPVPFGFSTKYLDAETGLLYYGFRYYNPSTGRWLSRDPIQERGGLNLYGMVNNNPIGRWDYLGLSDFSADTCQGMLRSLSFLFAAGYTVPGQRIGLLNSFLENQTDLRWGDSTVDFFLRMQGQAISIINTVNPGFYGAAATAETLLGHYNNGGSSVRTGANVVAGGVTGAATLASQLRPNLSLSGGGVHAASGPTTLIRGSVANRAGYVVLAANILADASEAYAGSITQSSLNSSERDRIQGMLADVQRKAGQYQSAYMAEVARYSKCCAKILEMRLDVPQGVQQVIQAGIYNF